MRNWQAGVDIPAMIFNICTGCASADFSQPLLKSSSLRSLLLHKTSICLSVITWCYDTGQELIAAPLWTELRCSAACVAASLTFNPSLTSHVGLNYVKVGGNRAQRGRRSLSYCSFWCQNMINVGELSNKLVGREETVVFAANESWHENKTTSSIKRAAKVKLLIHLHVGIWGNT